MPVYSTAFEATSNSVANTSDTFLELTSTYSFRIKRLKLSVATEGSDAAVKIRLTRKSAAGTGSVNLVPVKKDSTTRNSSVTARTKNSVNPFSVGTLTDIIDSLSLNARAIWEWIPKDSLEELRIDPTVIFGLIVECSVPSLLIRVSAEWED